RTPWVYPITPSPDLRDLHSFPTRRSSDLSDEAYPRRSTPLSRRTRVVLPGPVSNIRVQPPLPRASKSSTAPSRRPSSCSLTNARDRKSTRLNSSHVAISYAVFCLKKKRTL